MFITKLEGIYKRFGKLEALKGLDLSLEEGDVLGLIGENGAGKTTTIKVILGLEHPQKGKAELFGQDCSKDLADIRKDIGFVSETVFPPDYLTIQEAVNFHKQFYQTWDNEYSDFLINKLELNRDAKLSILSRGQVARVKLVLALSHHPKFLIADEITAGLDAAVRHDLILHLKEIIAKGDSTVLFSTNLLYDLENLVTKIAFLENGRILFNIPVQQLLDKFSMISFSNPSDLNLLPSELIIERIVDANGAHAIFESERRTEFIHNETIRDKNPKFLSLDLEKVFVYMVKNKKSDIKQ